MLNKVAERVRVSNEDGRTFVERVAEEVWQRPFPALGPLQSKREAKSRKRAGPTKEVSVDADNRVVRNISHFVMNLPDTAILFLDAFRGILKNISNDPAFAELYATMPMIHCHCFTRELEPAAAERDILEVGVHFPVRFQSLSLTNDVESGKSPRSTSFGGS